MGEQQANQGAAHASPRAMRAPLSRSCARQGEAGSFFSPARLSRVSTGTRARAHKSAGEAMGAPCGWSSWSSSSTFIPGLRPKQARANKQLKKRCGLLFVTGGQPSGTEMREKRVACAKCVAIFAAQPIRFTRRGEARSSFASARSRTTFASRHCSSFTWLIARSRKTATRVLWLAVR